MSDLKVPMMTLQPDDGRELLGNILILHGLRSSKEHYLPDMYELARVGFSVSALDLCVHGERPGTSSLDQRMESDYIGTMREIIYDTASDVGAIVTRWKANKTFVGIVGVSLGGCVAHVAAASPSAIDAIAIVISSPDWLTIDPAICPPEESPIRNLLATISPVNHPDGYPPKALLMLNGQVDDVVAPVGSKLLYERLAPIYEDAGISQRLRLVEYANVPHAYTKEMHVETVAWFLQHASACALRPEVR
jgi:alpha-beta hydrolase superfamily lysophospholipase